MVCKFKRHGILIIGVVLFIGVAFTGIVGAITAEEWNSLTADQINGNESYIFTGDGTISPKFIDGTSPFIPTRDITFDFTEYHGNFTNISSTTQQYQGLLFGYVQNTSSPITLTFKNLTLENMTVNSNTHFIGGILGYVIGTTGTPTNFKINFTNCKVNNCTITTNGHWVGGLVGFVDFVSMNVDNCSITNSTLSGAYIVAGLVGFGNSVTILNSTSENNHLRAGSDIAGGLIGYPNTAINMSGCTVMNCFVEGNRHVGGLVGRVPSIANFQNSAVINSTIAAYSDSVGGLIGGAADPTNISFENCNVDNNTVFASDHVGGVIGSTNVAPSTTTLMHCTALNCDVSGTGNNVGGLFGSTYNATIVDSDFQYCNVTGNCLVGGVAGLVSFATDIVETRITTCNITGNDDIGILVGGATYGSTITASECELTNSSLIGHDYVGGFVGCANSITVNATDCELMNCIVVGNDLVSTLIGYAYTACVNSSYCDLINSTVTGRNSIGGMVGYVGDCTIVNLSDFNLMNCTITGNNNIGGLVGCVYSSNVNISDSNLMNSTVTSSNNVGGMIGYAGSAILNTSNCNLTNSIVSGNADAGGLVGFAGLSAVTCTYCTVTGCTITANNYYVGGLIGYANSTSITHCEVIDCEYISGSYWVGGLIGCVHPSNPVMINNSKVTNTKIIGTSLSSSLYTMGGLIGSGISLDSDVNNNTLKDVLVNVTGGDAAYAYLFDISVYPICNTNGIAKFAQIKLANDNTIINSYLLNSSDLENTNFGGFENLDTEFTITVSNPLITVIDEDAFKDTNLTGIFNISSRITIGPNAFNGSKLTGGFYAPTTATVDANAFNGTNYLRIIYGNTTAELSGLNERTTIVNITDIGTLDTIKPGSFSISSENKFETVKLGNDTANMFKNLGDGTYLTINGPWTSGTSYLAENKYIPPQYTPSSSKQSGSTVILKDGQTAPTPTSTATPTQAGTPLPTDTPVAPTPQPTQQSPAPFVGLIAGLGAAALVFARMRR